MTKHIINEYFDNIYLLHISQRELDKINPKLTKKKIDVQYFRGYNGKANEQEFDLYLRIHRARKRSNPSIRLLTPGAFGHINSMINILKNAIKKKYKKILIMEPDIYFCKDFEDKLFAFGKLASLGSLRERGEPSEARSPLAIKETYKILYLGAYQYKFFGQETWPWIEKHYSTQMEAGYYHPYKTLGTFAVALDHSIFREYMELLEQKNMTSDVYLTKLQYKYRNDCIVCYPNLICCDLTRSSTTSGKNQKKSMKNLRWNIIPYDLVDHYAMKTIPKMKYRLELTINSFFPQFEIYIISLPKVIEINSTNMSKYIKKSSKEVKNKKNLQIIFTAQSSNTILSLRDIFIKEYHLISTERRLLTRTKKVIKNKQVRSKKYKSFFRGYRTMGFSNKIKIK